MVTPPNQPIASQPPTGSDPLPDQPTGTTGHGVMIALTIASVAFLVASLALLTFAISQRSSSPSGDVVVAEDGTDSGTTGGTQDDTGSGDGTDGETERTTTTARAATTTEAPKPVKAVTPIGVEASSTRESVDQLACTDEYMSYEVQQLIDGDDQLGWGVSAKDGAGQRATISFDGPVELTSVGLIPGYARLAPHSKADCRKASAFPLNRQIEEVRWTFDDGTSVQQRFELKAEMQRFPVEVTTGSVTLEILSTVRPSGADSDTIISEAAFEGRA